ncbi:hypothetical protein PG985_001696 [Apiospora marii]|uniref:uncharacterized protein n=1 Tax=Apiospora marii TaxID=335849 RepID=UPI00312F9B7A
MAMLTFHLFLQHLNAIMFSHELRPRAPRSQVPAALANPADPADVGADPAEVPGPVLDSGEESDEETIADLTQHQKLRESTD